MSRPKNKNQDYQNKKCPNSQCDVSDTAIDVDSFITLGIVEIWIVIGHTYNFGEKLCDTYTDSPMIVVVIVVIWRFNTFVESIAQGGSASL